MNTFPKSLLSTLSLITMIAALFAFSACNNDDGGGTPDGPDSNIAQLAASTGEISTLNSLLANYPDLVTALSGDGNFTVFAPSNQAFTNLLAALDKTSADQIPASVIREILEYHVITSAALLSTELSNTSVATLDGESITVNVDNGVVLNGSVNVTSPDIEATNGVVHIVDAVLIPPSIAPLVGTVAGVAYFDVNFTTLVAALVKADLVTTLINPDANFTVFAPTNDAFTAAGITSLDDLDADALTPILLYHVLGMEVASSQLENGQAVMTQNQGSFYISLNDNGAFINGNTEITGFDITASNGTVHVIDRTLLPPTGDIVAVAQAAGFTELAAALTRANLVETVQGPGPFTVFAPTNDAFTELYRILNVSGVDEIPVATLTDVLLYHVVSGRVFSTDLTNGAMVDPVLEGMTTFTVNLGDQVTITDNSDDTVDAEVTGFNVLATNGVVHVIDQVILP